MLSARGEEPNAADRLLDDAERLAELVNHCFWASIHLEEGRAIRGTVCICSQIQVPSSQGFEAPHALSIGVLVSLLTACPGSSLGVQLGAKGIEVWGILNTDPLWVVAIRIAGPGLLIASDDHQVLAVLERGEELIPAQGGGYDWMQLVAKALPLTVDFSKRLERALVIQRLVAAIQAQGHGGALVVGSASNHDWMKAVDIRFKFNPTGATVIRKRLAHLEDAQRQLKERRLGVVDPTAAAPSTASPPETLVTANQSLLEELRWCSSDG
jgi:hypothetical protein